MANTEGSTLTALSQSASKEEAFNQTMAFPPVLGERQKKIAELVAPFGSDGNRRPDAYMPTRSQLDQLVKGKNLDPLKRKNWGCDWANWSTEIAGAMEWYEELSWEALTELYELDGDQGDIERRLTELTELLGGVHSAYAPARKEMFKELLPPELFPDQNGAATVELLKRYRLYGRYVESLVLEVWSHLNRDLLLRPDFGFIEAA